MAKTDPPDRPCQTWISQLEQDIGMCGPLRPTERSGQLYHPPLVPAIDDDDV